MKIDLKIRKLCKNARIPFYSQDGDAGLDLTAVSLHKDPVEPFIEYGTGLAVEIPPGYVGLMFPRSSISDRGMSLANAVGVIDSNYRGEIKLRFYFKSCTYEIYEPGDRVGQLIVLPYPRVCVKEVEQLSKSSRDKGGFGSTGR